MRARGAKVTDIAVVVVAADDGVMPQTLEAISHAKAAKVPIVIALNKIDKPDANPDRVKTELSEAGVIVEEYGGDTPLVPVSARTRVGLDELIEMILLVADLQELKANPKRAAVGTIVEAQLDKNRGAVATAIVQTGTLRVGDVIVVGETFGKVRALENDEGKRVTKAGPSSAVVVLGLSAVPEAGDILRVVPDEKAARAMVETRKAEAAAKGGEGSGRATLEDLYRQIQAGQAKELRIILKADVSGSLGAITHALEQLNQDEIRINVLHEGAGDITDNDIMLASASDAIIVGFNTKITETARRAAEAEGVDVRLYDIIYKLTDDIDAALKGLLEPEIVEVVEGRAEVRQIFRVGKSTVIAGCFVTDGRIVRGGARVWRGGKVIATDRIESLRRFRDDVREVAANYECGIGLAGFNDLEEGDIIECFSSQTVSRGSLAELASGETEPMTARTDRIDELFAAGDRRDPPRATSTTRGSGSPRSPTSRRRRTCAMPRCSVSVIGQPDERKATLVAMGRAMPFVRHELGKRLRLKRIPEFHLELDDTLERGTRVLHLLDELEAGRVPEDVAADGEIAADAGAAAPPRGRRGRGLGAAARGRRRRQRAARRPPVRPMPRQRTGPPGSAQPVIDLSPWTPAVPDAVVDRIAAARRVLAVGHENPDADTIGATLAVCRLVEPGGGIATPVFADPVPPLYAFLPGHRRAPGRTPTRRSTTTCSSCRDCGSARPGRRGRRPPPGAVRAPAAGRHRPPRLERRDRPGRLGRPGRGRDLRDDRAARGPPRRAARRGRRGARGRS